MASSRRVSKRYGTYPGVKIKRYQRLAVVVDTSGSIQRDDLELMFGEIHGMWRQGAGIDVVECDAAVQHTWQYRGRLPDKIHGGGGTAFDPAFQWLRANRMTKYDGCIYLTDGYAPKPTVRPPCKLLWLVTESGGMGEHLVFGRSVLLEG